MTTFSLLDRDTADFLKPDATGGKYYPARLMQAYSTLADALREIGIDEDDIPKVCASVAPGTALLSDEGDQERNFVILLNFDGSAGIYRPYLNPLFDTVEQAKRRAETLCHKLRAKGTWAVLGWSDIPLPVKNVRRTLKGM